MGPQEIVEMVVGLTEDRVKKLNLDKWLAVETARIVNKKDWWWKKKVFSFDSVVGTATYNLADTDKKVGSTTYTALGKANDFVRMVKLKRKKTNTEFEDITFESDTVAVVKLINDTTQDEPSVWCIEPGTTKVIRLSAIPSLAQTFVGIYEAGLPLDKVEPLANEIPLIPPEHHDVVLFALLKRVMFYLYGQKDPRYLGAAEELKEAYDGLNNYLSPATEEILTLNLLDTQRVVRATRA